MDNARIHKAAMVKQFMTTTPRVKFIFTAAYSPEINYIENVFNRIKRKFKQSQYEPNK